MRATTLRAITARLPLPGRLMRGLITRLWPRLSLPLGPVIIETAAGRFEIRDCGEYIQRNLFFLSYHEYRETRLCRAMLRAGDTFVDAGANIGWFTVLAAGRIGSAGRVFAFEPCAPIREHLQRNIALNSLTNVEVLPCALGETAGTAVLSVAGSANLGTGTITRPESGGEAVEMTTLDRFCEEKRVERIDFLKVDVEGAEAMVLRGARRVLEERRCARILVEVNDRRLRDLGGSARELLEMLHACGYALRRVHTRGLVPIEPGDVCGEENIFAVVQDRAATLA